MELPRQLRGVELEELLGLGDALETVSAQIVDVPVFGQVRTDEGSRGIGYHDLAAPPDGGDPCRATDLEAAVVVASAGRHAGVQADAQLEVMTVGPPMRGHGLLDTDRRARGFTGIAEDDEERITLGAYDLAAMLLDRRPHDGLVLSVQRVIARSERTHELHGALDIGAQERDRALGQRHHLASRSGGSAVST